MVFDITEIRSRFPALNQTIDGQQPVFFDGPGGTQVPQSVLDAMTGYLGGYNSNLFESPFFAVQKTHEIVAQARQKAAAFVNAGRPDEIVFGPTMSALTAHVSRSLSREWQEGDEIIVTALDHFANVSFWEQAAADKGIKCHRVRIHPEDCTLDYDHLEEMLSPKTRLVAFTLASNATGSMTEARRIIGMACGVGALTYADSVHAAPHLLPDVQDLGCDFLACSAYKFFGPHLAFLYGRSEHWERLKPYKVEPASDIAPESWEMGTKSFEALSGFSSVVDYLGSHSNNNDLRENLKEFYQEIAVYEQQWSWVFLERAGAVPGLKVYGIIDPTKLDKRTSTFALTIEGHSPQAISDHLARHCIGTGSGNFYAKGVVDALGLSDTGGVVRVGCVHYNTMQELDRLFEVLDAL